MPLYQTKCVFCGTEASVFRKVAERDNLPPCDHCAAPVKRILVAPSVVASFESYVSPGTGKIISSRSQQSEDLKRSGAILAEPGLDKDIARNRLAKEEREFAPIAAAVDATVSQLVNTGKLQS